MAGDGLARRNQSVYAHHGTSKERAGAILETGFKQSEDQVEWLGFGIYFFEDAPSRAYQWGKKKYPGEEVCILDAEIALERCLNLLDPEGVEKLKPNYSLHIAAVGVENAAMLKSTRLGNRQLDCHVINFACERWAENDIAVHVVRGAFEEGDPLHSGGEGVPPSQILDRTHVQLAVRDCRAILDVLVDEAG